MKDSNPIESKSHTLKQLDNLMHFRYLLFREGVSASCSRMYSCSLIPFWKISATENLMPRKKK